MRVDLPTLGRPATASLTTLRSGSASASSSNIQQINREQQQYEEGVQIEELDRLKVIDDEKIKSEEDARLKAEEDIKLELDNETEDALSIATSEA